MRKNYIETNAGQAGTKHSTWNQATKKSICKATARRTYTSGIYMGEGLMALKRIESDSVRQSLQIRLTLESKRPLDAAYPTFGKIIPHGLQHGLPKLTGS